MLNFSHGKKIIAQKINKTYNNQSVPSIFVLALKSVPDIGAKMWRLNKPDPSIRRTIGLVIASAKRTA